VRAEVERLLGVPAAVDDPATQRVLLSTRVHLAHAVADNERAIATAAWIRSLQPEPAEKAFAGLTTLASVAARIATHNAAPETRSFLAAFEREFAARLASLPHTPAIVAMLRGQREKIAAMTREALLAEARDKLAPALRGRSTCTLAEADAIVRVRHRIEGILPTRDTMLKVFDTAIAARASR
jgi:hypothetical protein